MIAHRSLCLILVMLMLSSSLAGDAMPPTLVDRAAKEPHKAQVLQYRSSIYGDLQQFGFCATDFHATPKPLIVELMPGTFERVERAAGDCATICRIAADAGLACVAVRPSGQGNGSVFQGFGEVDVYDVIEAVARLVPIDRDRITVTGASMGGAASWYHASHYPDVWAAAAPFCGYCDYQLWKKPGGTTFHRSPWEEFSWLSRGASYRVENLRHVPVRIVHGEWDRGVGGGVDVEHSRSMDRKLTELGFSHEYHEVPQTGHGCRTDETLPPTVLWLLKQKKVRDPDQVSLVVHTLRHNKSAWVAVEQQIESGKVSRVESKRIGDGQVVRVQSENVARLQLGPLASGPRHELRIDGTRLSNIDLASQRSFVRGIDGGWSIATAEISVEQKRSGLSGPMGDIFLAPVIVIYGTAGNDSATHHNRTMASEVVRFFRRWNGGVHRGGINGDNEVRIPVLSDQETLDLQQGRVASIAEEDEGLVQVDSQLLKRANLFLIGDFANNTVMAELADRLPLAVGRDSLQLAGKEYRGSAQACLAVFPHPDHTRYVAVLTGQTPDAICWGSHVGLQLVPDFLVFDRERVVDWGFWDNHWRNDS